MRSKLTIIKSLLFIIGTLQLFSCNDVHDNSALNNEEIFFQTINGNYLSARRNQDNIILANSTGANDWETFYIEPGEKNFINIITKDGFFLGTKNNNNTIVALPKQEARPNYFILIPKKEYYNIGTVDGKFLTLNNDFSISLGTKNNPLLLKINNRSNISRSWTSLKEIDFFRFFLQLISFIATAYILLKIIKNKSLRHKFSFYALLIVGFTWAYVTIHNKNWKTNNVIVSDVIIYYEYLPAAIVFNDLSFAFTNKLPSDFNGAIWLNDKEKTGSIAPKYTIGMAIVYLPFFMVGHIFAGLLNYTQYGYSLPYLILICFSSWFYAFLGLFYLRKTLLQYFNDNVVAFSLLSIGLGTNLFYYVTQQSAMSHAYSFGLCAIFIWYTIKWHNEKKLQTAILLGFLIGLISLIRPTNALIALVFIFFDISNLSQIKQKFQLFWTYKVQIMFLSLFAILVWAPQLCYWKYMTGHWFFFSYGDEGFFFTNPHILDGLFSYRKGWLLYTPIMVFAITGLIYLFKEKNKWSLSIIVFLMLNIYVVYSWWCWWYGGSFGSRPMVDSYAILAIPLAAFFSYFDKKTNYLRSLSLLILSFAVILNLFQTLQSKTCLHYDGMTKEAYWTNFTTLGWSQDYEKLIKSPNYEKALKGQE